MLHSTVLVSEHNCMSTSKGACDQTNTTIRIDFFLCASLSLSRFVGRINIYLDRDEPIAR